MSNFRKLFKSFHYAFCGFKEVILKEQSFRIQLAIAFLIMLFAVLLGISVLEFVVLLMAIIIVLALELVNSVFERIVDIINPEFHPKVRAIKDISAGVVLLASIGAAIIGLLIFLPYIFHF